MEIMKEIAESGAEIFFQTAHAESSAIYKVEELKNLDDIIDYLRECGFKNPKLIHTAMHSGKPRYMVKA
jgi:hypothetical protein